MPDDDYVAFLLRYSTHTSASLLPLELGPESGSEDDDTEDEDAQASGSAVTRRMIDHSRYFRDTGNALRLRYASFKSFMAAFRTKIRVLRFG